MIRIICPQDSTIKCVERQARRMDRRLKETSIIYVVRPNDESKTKCHWYLRQWGETELVVFMGHGRSDALIGSCGRYHDMVGGDEAKDRDSDEFYNDERFIDATNYDLMAGKKVVCFACNSDELAKHLVGAGAICVIGFGAMPSSKKELLAEGYNDIIINKTMLGMLNGALNVAFREAMIMATKMMGDMDDIAVYFKMEIRRQISLLLHSRSRHKFALANILYDVAGTVKVVRP